MPCNTLPHLILREPLSGAAGASAVLEVGPLCCRCARLSRQGGARLVAQLTRGLLRGSTPGPHGTIAARKREPGPGVRCQHAAHCHGQQTFAVLPKPAVRV
eukprot:84574-Prymnesium_polylepis.1